MKGFEIAMVILFGLSWPTSILKSWRSRSTGGKSLLFMCFILVGYGCGIVYKIGTGFDFASYFYILNAAMVSCDIALFLRNRALERAGAAEAGR